MDWFQLMGDFHCTKADKQKAFKLVEKLVKWAQLTRANGLLSMEEIAEAEEDIFLKHGMRFILTGSTQEEWARYATAWILADQAKGERLLEMAIITEGLSLLLAQTRPQDVLIRLGAWFGSDLAAEVEQTLKTMEARKYREWRERRLQACTSSLPEFDKLLCLAPDVLEKVIPAVDRGTLAIALNGASGKTYQMIMRGMPSDRQDEMVKSIDSVMHIRLCDVVEAQRDILKLFAQEMSSR